MIDVVSSPNTSTYLLPSAWREALLYSAFTGLTDSDKSLVLSFLTSHPHHTFTLPDTSRPVTVRWHDASHLTPSISPVECLHYLATYPSYLNPPTTNKQIL